MHYHWSDIAGNLGVLFILSTYFLLQMDKIQSKSWVYGVCNAAGAFLVLISLFFKFNLSAFLVEFFWLAISVVGLIRIRKNRT